MSEPERPEQKRDESADVLANLIAGEAEAAPEPAEANPPPDDGTIFVPPPDDIPEGFDDDAVAPAAGAKTPPADPSQTRAQALAAQAQAIAAQAQGVATIGPTGAAEGPPPTVVISGPVATTRRGRSAHFARLHAKVNAHAYKKTMIPLLVVVGALLLLVGVCGIWLLTSADTEARGPSWSFKLVLVTVISFPLAGVLGIGAWWFHRDLKRLEP